jgi:hypothetical protein
VNKVANTKPRAANFCKGGRGVYVPLRISGGTRLKIYEALAMECQVISTTAGAEGLPLQDGKGILLADMPEKFAATCAFVENECELTSVSAPRVEARTALHHTSMQVRTWRQ